MPVRFVELSVADLDSWLSPALDIYVAAMGYPRGTQAHRAPLWTEHTRRPGWQAVGALDTDDRTGREHLVGIGYGYRGAPDQWWNQQLCIGLRQAGFTAPQITEITRDYFELTELHIDPARQGSGLGHRLLTRLLADRLESSVLLSTPEVAADDNRAWRLYRRLGFDDLLRHFSFTGDPRPFAVLGRRLPLRPSGR
ncbi:GNAT family N-acetyltransferase [Williamsia deligens]|uniref:GNAT family N-acetyltransferase n=1 Tax=Williamsia deligens TaxID=321325 RepID=A0ABW3GDS3_9NOCA|nr:GNAT family N-acetyltransferase [Williamsia deligens]MCP2195858.1 Acetyltransferase (GNAT) family protein [Williamsia deligens]